MYIFNHSLNNLGIKLLLSHLELNRNLIIKNNTRIGY